ncbi:hypothetical protein Dimus_004038 [Dionaea muscipula]
MDKVTRLALENGIVIFSKSSYYLWYTLNFLFQGLGFNPLVFEIDKDPEGREMEKAIMNLKPKDLRSSQPSRAELMTKLQQQRDEDATTFTNRIEEMEVNQQKYINELHVDHQRAMDELKDDHRREMDTIHAEMRMLKQLLQGHGYSVPDPIDS